MCGRRLLAGRLRGGGPVHRRLADDRPWHMDTELGAGVYHGLASSSPSGSWAITSRVQAL